MADSDDAGGPADLAGWHGDNWCVYPSMFGPPDQVDEFVMRWLVIPGPPMSCTLVLQLGSPVPNNERYAYHKHLNTWSIHVCIAGKGKHYAEGNVSEIVPGTIFYEAPGAVHTAAPDPGHSLLQACIQYPILGYENETKVVPEAGTLERWGDLQEFIKLFGPDGEKYKKATAGMFKSERWLKYVTNRRG
jgi:hypothetical protein